ncbi:MAG: hypothetical protein R3293_02380 [Candidatus Promineifilaceae bacterium]|nr:hypothetical protein [Candidatus Promineifilaceae bacterium]
MLEQFVWIAILVIIIWLVGYIVYLRVSQRERDLEDDLQEVSDLLGDESTR